MPGAGLVARYSPFERGGHAHGSGGNRRSASFLCPHLASHGYVVAALDPSEVIAPEPAGRADETAAERAARIGSIIASRVPDVRFLLDFLLGGGVAVAASDGVVRLDFDRDAIGLVGHSFGGWTVLAPACYGFAWRGGLDPGCHAADVRAVLRRAGPPVRLRPDAGSPGRGAKPIAGGGGVPGAACRSRAGRPWSRGGRRRSEDG